MSSAYLSTVEHSVIIAFKGSGASSAICRELKPPQLIPIIPIFPSHQLWAANQLITSKPSLSSDSVYSSSIMPLLSPFPRISTLTQAYPCEAING